MSPTEVFCRLCPSPSAKNAGSNAGSEPGSTVISEKAAIGKDARLSCMKSVFPTGQSKEEVYRATASKLIIPFMNGENVCFMALGVAQMAQHSLTGYASSPIAIVPLAFVDVFAHIGKLTFPEQRTCSVRMEFAQVLDENVRDLLAGNHSVALKVDYSAEQGTHVVGMTACDVTSARQATELFRQAIAKATLSQDSSFLINLHMKKLGVTESTESGAVCSTFSLVALPSVDCISRDVLGDRLQAGPKRRIAIQAVNTVVQEAAAASTSPHRPLPLASYEESVLTRLLEDVLGGNWRLQCLVLVPVTAITNSEASANTILSLAKNFAGIRTSPLINTPDVQRLLARHRATILHYKCRATAFRNLGADDEGSHLEAEMLRREKVELEANVLALEEQLAQYKVSGGLTMKEQEEHLQVSESLLQRKMENLKLQEQVALLESQHEEMKVRMEDQARAFESLQEDHEQVTEAHRQAADSLHSQMQTVVELKHHHDQQLAKNEDLELEIVRLVKAKQTVESQMADSEKILQVTKDKLAFLGDSFSGLPVHGHIDPVKAYTDLQYSFNQMADASLREKAALMQNVIDLESEKAKLQQKVSRAGRDKEEEMAAAVHHQEGELEKLGADNRDLKQQLESTQSELGAARREVVHMAAKLSAEQARRQRADDDTDALSRRLSSATTEFQARLTDYLTMTKGRLSQDQSDLVDSMVVDFKAAEEGDRTRLLLDCARAKSQYKKTVALYAVLLHCYGKAREELAKHGAASAVPEEANLQGPLDSVSDSETQSIVLMQQELAKNKTTISGLKEQVLHYQSLVGGLEETVQVMAAEATGAPQQRASGATKAMAISRKMHVAHGPHDSDALDYLMKHQGELERQLASRKSQVSLLERSLAESEKYVANSLKKYNGRVLVLRSALEELLEHHNAGRAPILPSTPHVPRNLAKALAMEGIAGFGKQTH